MSVTRLLQLTDIHTSLLTKVHTFQIRSLSPDAPLEPEIPTEHFVLTSPGPSGLGELPQPPVVTWVVLRTGRGGAQSAAPPAGSEPRACVSSRCSLSLVLAPRLCLRLFPQEFGVTVSTSVTRAGGVPAGSRRVTSGRMAFLSVNTGCLYVCLCL